MLLFEILKALLFGVIEGVTEWLPISSTGHMIILDSLMPLEVSREFYELFSVVIQLGAIMAVAVKYFQRLSPFTKRRELKVENLHLLKLTVMGVIPSAVMGLLLDDLLDKYLYNPYTVAAMLALYGVGFIVVERWRAERPPSLERVEAITLPLALKIGAFQVLSLIPGTSRSGATILGGMMLGLSREAATEFSFFLALPTMLGAGALKTVKYFAEGMRLSCSEIFLLLTGTLSAYCVSIMAIEFLTDYVKKHSFVSFAVYRICLGIAVMLYFLLLQ